MYRRRPDGACRAVVSSSGNASAVLAAIGVAEKFAVVVDGIMAERHDPSGKPDPATVRLVAAALGVAPGRAVVVEDATLGVAAGRAGEFGLVVGVDRGAGAAALAGLRECRRESIGAIHV